MCSYLNYSKCRERIYKDKIKNQILLCSIEILKESLAVNLPVQVEFFSFEALYLCKRIEGYLLHYYSVTKDLTALLLSFDKVYSLINTYNAIKFKSEIQDLIEISN